MNDYVFVPTEHLDGCRKTQYDQKSSPCTCRDVHREVVSELRSVSDQLQRQNQRIAGAFAAISDALLNRVKP